MVYFNRLFHYILFATLFFVSKVYSQGTYLDNFNTAAYNNNNGTLNFSTNWIESGDDNSASGGYIRITGNELRFAYLWTETIRRTANLSLAATANLSFNWRTSSLEAGETLAVQVSSDGVNYTTLTTFGGTNSGIFSQDISGFISATTTVRFVSGNNNWSDNNDRAFIDNFLITVTSGPRISIDNVTVNETSGSAIFTVTHTGGNAAGPFNINYETVNGTASSGSDYTFTSGTLNFTGLSGVTGIISVPIIDDGIPELDENFTIIFTGTSNPSVNISAVGTGTILSQIPFNQPLELVDQFSGYFDFTSTGGSFRTQPNTVDACAITTNSSNGLIAPIPPTATIEKAYLYWAHSSVVLDNTITFEGQAVSADRIYQSGITDRVFFGYVSDVTTIVNSIPNPSSNIYDVADLTIDNGSIYCPSQTVLGGWALMIFYTEPTLPAVSINLYQGFDGFSNAGTSFTLDSFFAIGGAGSKASFLSWEGDETLDGSSAGSTNPEELSITNQLGNTFILSGDGGQPGNNAYNSTLYDNTVLPIFNVSTAYGMDWDTFDISGFISPTDNQVTANVDVGQDFVISNAVVLKVPSNLITGRVFEDRNYPGGSGRNYASSGGQPISGATVELYNGSGTLVQSTTTAGDGVFTLAGMSNGNYSVRVVNSSVRSTRGGGAACITCYPVQTFRSFHNGISLVSVTNEVGGVNPAGQDSAAGVLLGAQTVSNVTIASNGVAGLDFGFNFSTIVNTNTNGQGSLNQFIINSNNLDEAGLDIAPNSIFDPLAGEDTSIFMIPPSGDLLGRPADPNYTGGYFNIAISNPSPLSIITGNTTKIDGRTQTAYSGNTNTGAIGASGTAVGVTGTLLPDYERPEIQLHRNDGDVLRLQGNAISIRNIAVYANSNSGIIVNSGSATITESLIGVNALGLNAGNISSGIVMNGGTVNIDGNYIATATNSGVLINGGTSTIVQNNHINANGNSACNDNVVLQNGSGIILSQNLIENTGAIGIEGWNFTGSVTINENTIQNSGLNGGNCSGSIENSGIRLFGNNSIITSNIIANNGGAGIVITGGNTSGNRISENSIYNNGGLGIDIDQSTLGNPTGDGITLNDTGDSDNGPNNSLNFPIISEAHFVGANLVIKGWTRPGTVIEFFLTDISEGTATLGDNQFGFSVDYGEGQTHIGTYIEGSLNDIDSTSSPYADSDGNTDNTNRFEFSIPKPVNSSIGDYVSATATSGNSTSEFSPAYSIKVKTIVTNRRITFRVSPY